jgi:uncharacterized repeat protein (TIGR03803 family)
MRNKKTSIALTVALAVFTVALLVTGTCAVAQTETVLYSFGDLIGGYFLNGALPYGGVIFDAGGNLYGTTLDGGTCCGTVFELSPKAGGGWTEKVYNFDANGIDGYYPSPGLVLDAAGNLYGTTYGGGAFTYGTVFELTPAIGGGWTHKILDSFGNGTDGFSPNGNLIFDAAGNLYGTTGAGGAYGVPGFDIGGTVFELTPNPSGSWTKKVLHSFGNGTDGQTPYAGLILDASGNLYGTTTSGGAYSQGTVFELRLRAGQGWAEKILHSFNSNGVDGVSPYAGLVLGTADDLYGTTEGGGNYQNGAVFELRRNARRGWIEKILHNFNSSDGRAPTGALILDAVGNLYGTTQAGGAYGGGTVFELVRANGNWSERVLHTFAGADGAAPYPGVILDGAGNLYGTTNFGGTYTYGTVFKITP